MRYRVLIVGFILVGIFSLVFVNIVHAQAQTQTVTPVPSLPITETLSAPYPTPALLPQMQRLSDLEAQQIDARLDKVETELQDLKKPFTDSWNTLGSVIASVCGSGWLIFAIIFLFLFSSQIRDVLKILPSRISNLKFKFGDTEITLVDVDNVVMEREILKTMIFVATIDDDPDPRELRVIYEKASRMNSKLDVLKKDDKEKIIQAAIDLATADAVFMSEEYVAIKTKAAQYKISDAEVNSMIRKACQDSGISLPPQLELGKKANNNNGK
jgi:hypothetical protein